MAATNRILPLKLPPPPLLLPLPPACRACVEPALMCNVGRRESDEESR